MKRVTVTIIMFILCAMLFILASCSSGAYNGDGDDFIMGLGETDDPSKPATASSVPSKSSATNSGSSNPSLITAYNFKFELSEDGTSYRIVENGVYEGTTIVIPAMYDDKPVTAIAPFTFRECIMLESITFSENLTDIPASAFYSCTLLKEIKIEEGNVKYRAEGNCLIEKSDNKIVLGCSTSVIPSSVTAIGEHAFYQCAGLKIIDIPASVTDISEKAYFGCTALEEIKVNEGNEKIYSSRNSENVECNCLIEKATGKVLFTCSGSNIPNKVSSYGDYAFVNNTKVTRVTIPEGATTISSSMLKNCENLEEIVIPDSVTSISGFAFKDCKKLRSIIIAVENSTFEVIDGCVIKKSDNSDKSVVLGACDATIPDGVTSICAMSFMGRDITSINIPSSVKNIGEEAFSGCGELISATFEVKEGWYIYYSAYTNQPPEKVDIEAEKFEDLSSAALSLSKSTTTIYHD